MTLRKRLYTTATAFAAVVALAAPAMADAAPRAFDASRSSGLYDVSHTWDAAVGDYNNDGWDDVLVVTHYESPARLYLNDQGRFRRVPEQRFPARTRDRHNCDWGHANGDGRLDVYCSVGGGRGYKRKPNELWIQQADGSFQDMAGIYRVRDLSGRGRDVTFLDANDDGLDDLFVGNDYPRYDNYKSKNRLFINTGDDRFRNGREFGVNRQVGGSQVDAADYNLDGLEDLLVCGTRGVFLYENVGGRRYRDVTRRARVSGDCNSATFARIDAGRRLDVVRLAERRLVLKTQIRNGTFRHRYGRRFTNAADAAVGRIDGNRRDDIYVVERGAIGDDRRDTMLVNRRGGRRFGSVRIPQTRRGKGDGAVTIDHDRNGRSDFIVLNGQNKARGPIRLIAFRR